MKNKGIIRNIDELGRVVVPKEMRKMLGINNSDPVEIFAEEDSIILKKFRDDCIFCGSEEELSGFKGKKICKKCLAELKGC